MNKEECIKENRPYSELEILKKALPHYFDKNGKFLIDKFKSLIEENKEDISKESYGLEWLGKSYARVLATEPARTLLREDVEWNSKEENKNSKNLLIKGDNLEVLKHLVNAYYEKVKMIYIDPPYNTGNDGFIYQDNRKFTPEELSKLAGISIEKAKRILDFVNSKSNSHSAWLTFMYPRLYVARQLLREDGVIFVSIDDNEVAQLRLLMDEIFGEENFVAIIPRKTGAGNAAAYADDELRKVNDFVLVYKKGNLKFNKKYVGKRKFEYEDLNGKYTLVPLQASGSDAKRSNRPNMYYPIYMLKDGSLTTLEDKEYDKVFLPKKVGLEDGRWIWSKKKFEENKDLVVIINDKLMVKKYLTDETVIDKFQIEKAWFENFPNKDGTLRIKELFSGYIIFSNPKPTSLIVQLLKMSTEKDDIILDFFAGSGTTADAVMQLNAEDGGSRRYILVQLPEPIDEKKNKTAYDFVKNELGVENPTIFDITKERIVRAARKIIEDKEKEIKDVEEEIEVIKSKEKQTKKDIEKLEELENKLEELKEQFENIKQLDFGFKIFETVDIPEEYFEEPEELTQTTFLFEGYDESNINALLTTWKVFDGISLEEELKEEIIDEYKIYYSNNKLYLIHKGFNTNHLVKILEKIDSDKDFNPSKIVINGYNFDSKLQREIDEGVKNFSNKKSLDIDVIVRY